MFTHRTHRLTAVLLAIGLAATACGGGSESATTEVVETTTTEAPAPAPTTTEAPAPAPTTPEAPAPAPTTTEVPAVVEDDSTYVARAQGGVDAYTDPSDADPSWSFGEKTDYGSTTVFLVNEIDGDWYNVSLPVRPNGTTGWVHADQVELRTVSLRVEIDLSDRTITVLDGDDEILVSSSVAIGTDENPTPTGKYFLTDKLLTGNPSGSYGPIAFGTSAFSDTLSEFAGGPGQIGIHGTNQPDSIGNAASHGCIRLPNDVVLELNDLLPLGTPVTITA